MIVNVDGLKLGGQLDRETSLVAFSYIVYFVHCAFSMLSENKFYLLTYCWKIGKVVMFASVLWIFMWLIRYTHNNQFNYLLFFQNGGQSSDKLEFTTCK